MIQKRFTFTLLTALILIGVESRANDSKERILFIGDSQSVGPFGLRLDTLLRKKFTVETYASCGSILEWWRTGQPTNCEWLQINQAGRVSTGKVGNTPILSDLLNRYRPDWVILQFGGNYRKSTPEMIAQDISQSLDQIEAMGARCFYVSNPDSRVQPTNGLDLPQALLDAVGSRCAYFRSDLVTKYPSTGGDGIHYSFKQGIPIAQSWAEAVFIRFSELF